MVVISYIGMGSNLGDREKNISSAVEYLKKTSGIKVTRVSSLYETDPVGGPPQGKFLNGAIEIETYLSPYELLRRLKEIEMELGRKKTVVNGPRTIDLDILFYGDVKIEKEDIVIPHPRMEQRDFVLRPLNEINPAIVSHYSLHPNQKANESDQRY